MSVLSDQIARSLDARDAGAARFGDAAAAGHALALGRVWEGRAAGVLVRGGTPDDGGDARHLAAAAAASWRAGTMRVELELPESELALAWRMEPIGLGTIRERAYPLAGRSLALLGIGLELYEPAALAGFLGAWLDRRPRSRAVMFAWTPYGTDLLAARYGGELWWRLSQQLVEVDV